MAAPRRNNNTRVTNVELTTRSVVAAPSTGEDISKRRISPVDNIRYIQTTDEQSPYRSTDDRFRRLAYQDNILRPSTYPKNNRTRYNKNTPYEDKADPIQLNRPALKNSRLVREGLKRAKEVLKKQGFYQDGDLENLLSTKKVELPPFPMFIFVIAILKDLFDITDFTIIGTVFTFFTSALFGVILFFWLLGKVGGKWWKKRVFNWLWKRYVFAMIVEFVPFLKLAPTMTIFIIMTHRRETKVVKAINFALEELKKVGAFRHIL
jgi:hypothetical protein